MVQFLKVPVNGNLNNFENKIIHGRNYLIFKILLIAIDWNCTITYPKSHKYCHTLRWFEWGLLVFCKQTPF